MSKAVIGVLILLVIGFRAVVIRMRMGYMRRMR